MASWLAGLDDVKDLHCVVIESGWKKYAGVSWGEELSRPNSTSRPRPSPTTR
jgi:hypothetical protein